MRRFVSKVFTDVSVKVISAGIVACAGLLFLPSIRSFFAVMVPLPVWGLLMAGILGVFAVAYFTKLMRPRRPAACELSELSETEIAQAIKLEVSGEGDGLTFWKNGADGTARLWLRVANFTPSPIEVDRMFGDIVVGAPIAKLLYLQRDRIDAYSERKLYIESSLTAEEIGRIQWQRQQRPDPPVLLNLTVHVTTGGRLVKLLRPQVATGNYRFMNFQP